MTVINKIARRYAKAFYSLAVEGKDASKLEKEVISLKNFAQENDVFETISNETSIGLAKQQEILSQIADKSKSHAYIKNLILVLNKNRRLDILATVCEEIVKLFELSRSEVKAKVISAKKLTASQEKKIGASLSKQTGWNVSVETEIDEDLIGGIVVKMGSYMIDSSIQTQLEKAKRQLKGAA